MNPSHNASDILRIATYNIHKGVQGLGPARRLEIHNLGLAVEQLDADIVCLQEVRKLHRREAAYFQRWPDVPQAEFLAPEGYEAVYRTNAITKHGEHGNALLSRWPVIGHQHEDISDHRFEQRGLLHVPVQWNGVEIHVVVVHLGLIHSSRVRQVKQVAKLVAEQLPPKAPVVIAGDFNDWNEALDHILTDVGLTRARTLMAERVPTYPSRVPVLALDRVYTRGLACQSIMVPRGTSWARLSDHLPLVAEFELDL